MSRQILVKLNQGEISDWQLIGLKNCQDWYLWVFVGADDNNRQVVVLGG